MNTSSNIKPRRFAAIDIGTVTCRMLVADILPDGTLQEITREYAITNLGEDVDKTGQLKDAAIDRVVDAVSTFTETLNRLDLPPTSIRAIATSAARDAKNGSVLVDRLARRGITLQIISGDTEAALSFAGVSAAFPDTRIAVVDVGGGSTEIITGASSQKPTYAHSFNMGCRRVTERFLHNDPPLKTELAEARAWIASLLAKEELSTIESIDKMIGVAGTATSVVSIRDSMEVYDSQRVHLSQVKAYELADVLERLAVLPLDARKKVIGLDPKRAPVIIAGLIILQEAMLALNVKEFVVSESDILHGIIMG